MICHLFIEQSKPDFFLLTTVFVFRPAIYDLRVKHRILGFLIGCLPDYGEQVAFNGPPLLLTLDEVAFIRSRNICPILDDNLTLPNPTLELKEKFQAARVAFSAVQEEEYNLRRKETAEKYRKEHRNPSGTSEAETIEAEKPQQTSNVSNFDPTLLIPLELPQSLAMNRRESLKELADLQYPRTPMEHLRFRVFDDLWSKGYYVQPDSRFKCDFLVYEGTFRRTLRFKTAKFDDFPHPEMLQMTL